MKFDVSITHFSDHEEKPFTAQVIIDNDLIENAHDKSEIDFFKSDIKLRFSQRFGSNASILVTQSRTGSH